MTCDSKLETLESICDLHIEQTKISLRKFEAILYGTPSKPILIHFLIEPTPPCLQRFSNTNFIVWRELGFTSIISPIFILGSSLG